MTRLLGVVVSLIALLGLIGCSTTTVAPPAATTSPQATSPQATAPSSAQATASSPATAASPTRGPARTKPSSAAPPTGGAAQTDPESGLKFIETTALPKEARDTIALIDQGGPFRYDKDGSTFGNFEGILPQQRRGYYKEYTVPTPGSRDRGARRIVTGDNDQLFYWTADHYQSFARIRR